MVLGLNCFLRILRDLPFKPIPLNCLDLTCIMEEAGDSNLAGSEGVDGRRAPARGSETEAVLGGDAELKLTRSDKCEKGISKRPTSSNRDTFFSLPSLRRSSGTGNTLLEVVDL